MLVNHKTFDFKFACDAFDFVTKPLGQATIGRFGQAYARKHCLIKPDSFDIEAFIKQCIKNRNGKALHTVSASLCDKYEVGHFKVALENCFDSDYVLFNALRLNSWQASGTDLFGLEFMVVPSRNRDGIINELGLRILNADRVHKAFKWLFPFGQQATFGLNLCDDGQLLLLEGFQDMIAFRESGYKNAVGLGSATVTDRHLDELKTDNWLMCGDMDYFGFFYRQDLKNKFCFYAPEGKDPYDAYLKHGKVDVVYVTKS